MHFLPAFIRAHPRHPRQTSAALAVFFAALTLLHSAHAEPATLAPSNLPTSAPVPASADTLIRDALAAESALDSQKALALFRQADALRPDNAFVLQKIAQQYSDSIIDVPADNLAEKKLRAETALAYSTRAVALAPDNPVCVLSLAVCHGKLAVYSDAKEKIRYSSLVREEAERALALDPRYDWAHHVLGRWHYEVASLGGTTRFFVRVIYGGLPSATNDQAIDHLERAVELAPQTSPHHLELGFAYLAANRPSDARAAFLRGLALPSLGKHDESAKQRARAALEKLAP